MPAMNILQAHKFYWKRDGASNYVFQLSDLLRAEGDVIVPFSMHHVRNIASEYEPFFVSNMDLSSPHNATLTQKIRYAGRMLYSFEAKHMMRRLLEQESIQVAHIHNIYHHISPSIFGELKKKRIPIVMTLHDYKLICPNYTMFHHGAVHEEDCHDRYGTCVKNKCFKDSRMQSSIVQMEMIFHHKIAKFYEKYVDKFIAPSQFIMDMCVKHGWPKEKFVHIKHPVDALEFSLSPEDGGYVAYVGRLSEEKGLGVLLEAAGQLPKVPFKIIGEGPMKESLEAMARKMKLKNVEWIGFQTGHALRALLSNARLHVLPSIWYENYPLSVLEAKAMGKVIIGSRIGGIPEMLPDDLLVEPGDAKSLAALIDLWYHAPRVARQKKGEELQNEIMMENDPKVHVARVRGVYADVQKSE